MTTENNKLIAEFMGYTQFASNYANELLGLKNNKWDIIKYNYSWDCLMPVVERIESLTYGNNSFNSFSFEIHANYVFIKKVDRDIIAQTHNTPKIEAVYKTVIEFINWYNQQNP